MTAAEIVGLVEDMKEAAEQAVAWMSPGGCCCGGPRAHGYCTSAGCVAWREECAVMHATDAAHAYHQIEKLAEVGWPS